MRSFHLLSLVFIALFLSLSHNTQAQHLHRQERTSARHRRADLRGTSNQEHKRDTSASFTYFSDGLGACGVTSNPGDFIVALNVPQYDGGAHCFESITITADGKTTQATIVDECVSCGYGDLDFSEGLFQFFAPLSVGELRGTWVFNKDLGATSSQTPTPSPTTTTTSSSTITAATSSSTVSTTTESSLTSTTVSSPSPTKSSVPGTTSEDAQAITQINLALLQLSSLLRASLTR